MQQTSTQTTIWGCKLQTIHTSQNEFGERKPNITQANMTHQNLNISKTMNPSGAMFHPIQGGNGCRTGPHVPSNPMHDLNVPCAKGKTPGGSAPLVMGPQAGPCSIQFRGGMGAVRAPMCPLIPCMTPTPHVPRGRRPVGARHLSWAPKRGHVQSIPGGGGV